MGRFEKWSRGLVFLLWGGFLVFLLEPGGGSLRLSRYLNPALWWLPAGGAAIIAVSLLALLRRPAMGAGPVSLLGLAPLAVQTGILLLPLVYFPAADSSRLSTLTYGMRTVAFGTMATSGNPERPGPAWQGKGPWNRTIYDSPAPVPPMAEEPDTGFAEKTLVELAVEPERYFGRRVEVIGQVAREPGLPSGQLVCYRFFMSCCAADSQPIGVLVASGQALGLADGTWVRVRGRLVRGELAGQPMQRIDAVEVLEIEAPAVSFMYPPF